MNFNSKKEGNTEPQSDKEISNESNTEARNENETCPFQATVFQISEYFNCRDNIPKQVTHTWQSFCEEFRQHPAHQTKDGPAWSPASYPEGFTRKNENVDQVHFAVIDVDIGTSHKVVLERFSGYAYLAHSSFTHSPEKEKYRIILPLAHPVPAAEWLHAWARINQQSGNCNDANTKDPSRLFYKPAHPIGTHHHFTIVAEGKLLNVEDLPEVASTAIVYPLTFHRKGSYTPAQRIEGIESDVPDLNFEQGLTEVVNRCAFMQFASAPENQDELSEPLWMAMISNACRFENSEPWIHAASEKYSGYDEGQTDARIERYRNGTPPVTCQRIRDLGFTHCPQGGCKRPNGEATKAPAGLMGWMFHRQLTTSQSAQAELPSEYVVAGFKVAPDGIFRTVTNKDGEPEEIKLGSRIDVVALTRDHDSNHWGMELQFADPDGITKHWALPKELLASTGDSYRASLLKMGVSLEPGKGAREGFAAYLAAAMPEARALSVRQPGWFNGAFVLPNAVYGRSDERVVFQTNDPDEIKRFSEKGTLESWQQHIALPCQGNSRAVISICIGLASPLLALLGEDNGGFHLRGNSSIGKSVCLFLGSSVWGGNGLIRTWNMTVNGLEGVATMHNDVLLPLDELGQADGKAAGEAAYMLGNGQGKSRSNREGDARAAKRFRNIVLSSGERSIGDVMAQAGQMVMAGQEVRMVEIAADAGCGLGVFENIHGARSSQVFAETLKRDVAQHHGHAGRAFVECLANPELQPKLVERIKALIQRFVDTYVPEGATGQVGRVGRRFGLVAAAGELAIELGILPWPEGEACAACAACFQSWIDIRGGIGNHEAEQAVAKVRRFIELHGESRFTLLIPGIDNNADGKTIQRAGFRQVTDDGRTEFFILPEVYRTEVCTGMNSTYVTKVMIEKGFLAVDSRGKPQIEKRLPSIGRIRLYHLKADLMGESVSQVEKCETTVRQAGSLALPMKYIV